MVRSSTQTDLELILTSSTMTSLMLIEQRRDQPWVLQQQR